MTVIERMSAEQYNELDGLRCSNLKHALVSALEYQLKSGGIDDCDKFRVGRANHTACLEPQRLLAEYAEWRTAHADGSKRIRSGGAWDEFRVLNESKTILTDAQFAEVMTIRDAVRDHPVAGPLLKGIGRNELSLQWKDERTGELCKGRLDRLTKDGVLVDLKFTADPAPDPFTRIATRLRYPMQAAFYHDGARACGLDVERVVFIAVQSKAPHDLVCYDFGSDILQHGRNEYERAIDVVLDARKKQQWLGQATEHALPFILPPWVTMMGEEIDNGTTTVTFDGEAI